MASDHNYGLVTRWGKDLTSCGVKSKFLNLDLQIEVGS